MQIISRGEAPSTEGKLIHAGANKVILPTHIGAERIAELILYPATARLLRGTKNAREVERTLRQLGLEIEVVSANEHSGVPGLTVAELEQRAAGAFFVAQIDRPGAEPIARPAGDTLIEPGDGLAIVGRDVAAFGALFGQTD